GNVTLTDVMVSDLVGGVTVAGGPITLAPGEEDTTTFTASYTITQADIDNGTFTNSAEVVGTTPAGAEVTDISNNDGYVGDNPTVIELCQNPAIAIVKTGVFNDENGDDCSDVDETITYTFTVTNQGNVSLSNIIVDDPLLGGPLAGPISGDTDGDGELDVTETWIYEASYTITQADIDAGEVVNQATATGTAPDQSTVSDLSGSTIGNDEPTVIELCQNPAIAIVKTGVFNDENDDGCTNVDETITYTFTVTNQGNVSLSNIIVDDPLLGGPLAGPISGDTDGDGELDVTETWIYEASYAITQVDIDAGEVVNQATATGTAPDQSTVSDLSGSTIGNDEPTVIELCQNPVIAIVKTGIFNDENGDDCSDVDETITYTFTVTNQGNVSMSNIIVDDPLLGGPIAGPISGDTDGDGELDVTETWIFEASYTITQADIDAGEVVNQATATGTAPDQSTVSDLSGSTIGNDEPTVIELCQNPAIAIVKAGVFNDENGDDCSDVDETITYTFTVTNQGNVSLSNIIVDDPLLGGPIAGPISGDTDGDGELDVTETWIYEASYAITQADIDAGEVLNQATATGTAPDQSTVSDLSGSTIGNDDPTVIELCQNPAIAIVKTGVFNDENGDACSNVDETITYTFTVTNQGNVSLSNIIVDDPLLGGPIAGPISGDTDGDGELDVTETWIYEASYTITQADIDAGEVVNQATATGTAPDQSTVSDLSGSTIDDDEPTIIDLCQKPEIVIVKTGVFNDENGDACSNVDETITYTFTVINQGNVSLSNIIIDDPLLGGPIAGPLSGDTDGDGELDVTETWIYEASYAITQADIDAGEVVNQATATGTAPDQTVVSDDSGTEINNDDPTIIDLCQKPEIVIVKTGVFNDENGDGCSDVDETITYTFTVTNQGNVSLSNIIVDDPLLGGLIAGPLSGDTDGDGELDVTETWIYEASYAITQADIDAGEVVNQATATGTAPDQTIVSDDSGTAIDNDDPIIITLCQNASIAVIKVGTPVDENNDGCAGVDETIIYTFSVKNTGNVSLTNVIITDPLVTVTGGPIDLAAGEEDVTTFTATYIISQTDVDAGFIENQALAEGIAPAGNIVSDLSDHTSYLEDNPTITSLCNNPSISLEKSGVFNDENGDGASDVGETISYTFVVTNTGDVTLYNITISDPLPGIVMSGGPIEVLQPGEVDSTTFTATYSITQQDIDNGEVVNLATVTGEDNTGATVEDEAEAVVVLPDVLGVVFEIFNGITPNGDGMNDFFWIRGINNYPNNNVKIFNRWGVLVYETDGYGQGEDDSINTFRGISEGRVTVQKDKELPTGTYFYILTFQGENPGKDTYTGYLYINR
uniref:gliding motility-associated C-terminal domain-containing protein n=1 Tax=Aequorivita sinensis TaxID=1382458 RepID=UPI002300C920